MALSVPTTKEISDNIVAQIETEIGKTIPLWPKSFTRVLAKALAGIFVLVYKYASWSLLQQFAEHASWRETIVNGRSIRPLIEWGRLVGVGDPRAATNARFTVSVSILNPDGTVLPAGRQLVHPSSGVIYITETTVTLNAATVPPVSVIAASDPDNNGGAGTVGNRAQLDVLEWANPIPQIEKSAVLLTVLFVAEDAETEEAYRDRVVRAFRARAMGGAYADYAMWAVEADGIIAAYPYTGDLPGSVEVYVEASGGTPTQEQMDAVYDLIEFDGSGIANRRPVSAVVYVRPVTRQAFDVEVQGLSAPDPDAAKASITEALEDFLGAREPFILGLSPLPRTDRVTAANVSGTVDDSAGSLGASVTSVVLKLGGTPISAYTLAKGQKAELGTILFT